jgi:DNA mismatch repair protein MutH
MKPIIYILFLFVIPSTVSGQVFYEQIAFDYFKEVVSDSVYGNKTLFKVEPKIVEYSPIYRPGCHQNDVFRQDWKDLFSMDSLGIKTIESINKNYRPLHPFVDNSKIPKPNFKTKTGIGKRARKVNVSEPVILKGDSYIVTVMVHIPHGLDNYFVEVSKDGEVTKWCKGGVVY